MNNSYSNGNGKAGIGHNSPPADMWAVYRGIIMLTDLTKKESELLGWLADFADKNTEALLGEAFPSHDTLAALLGVHRTRVAHLLKSLSDKGYISWRRTGRSNLYTVNVERILERMREQKQRQIDLARARRDVSRPATMMCQNPQP